MNSPAVATSAAPACPRLTVIHLVSISAPENVPAGSRSHATINVRPPAIVPAAPWSLASFLSAISPKGKRRAQWMVTAIPHKGETFLGQWHAFIGLGMIRIKQRRHSYGGRAGAPGTWTFWSVPAGAEKKPDEEVAREAPPPQLVARAKDQKECGAAAEMASVGYFQIQQVFSCGDRIPASFSKQSRPCGGAR